MIIFAGIDSTGALRYIDRVASGLACECFCVVCGSPLIARKGDVKIWHFAHEAGQERPQCSAGAANLMQRIAREYLMETGAFPLPPYSESVFLPDAPYVGSEKIGWPIFAAAPAKWLPHTSSDVDMDMSQGSVMLDTCDVARIYVRAGKQARPQNLDAHAPSLLFWAPLPDLTASPTREWLHQFLRQHGTFEWLTMPDAHGLRAKAVAHLEDNRRRQQERQRLFGTERSVVLQKIGLHMPLPMDRVDATPPPRPIRFSTEDPCSEAIAEAPPRPAWAAEHLPNSTIMVYRLRDGSSWVLYQTIDGPCSLRQWPQPEEGWDEAFPPSIGQADAQNERYLVPTMSQAIIGLARMLQAIGNTSDPARVRDTAEALQSPK